MTRACALLFLLPVAACTYPAHRAARTVEFQASAAELRRLECASHNGRIEYVGDPAATAITVRAELSVRGHTAAEAAENLQLLDVGQETVDGALRLAGRFPRATLQRCSPSFAFTITGPARLELGLVTHNGGLSVRGADAATQATTHNGEVEFRGRSRNVVIETHNGGVEAEFAADGELHGEITTHNGGVTLAFPGAVDAALTARTHNGSLRADGRLADAAVGRRELTGRLGSGAGKLDVTTHNGDVTIR